MASASGEGGVPSPAVESTLSPGDDVRSSFPDKSAEAEHDERRRSEEKEAAAAPSSLESYYHLYGPIQRDAQLEKDGREKTAGSESRSTTLLPGLCLLCVSACLLHLRSVSSDNEMFTDG
jgi:hypothetical protein